jgi:Tfp pilus assembly protein PilX
MPVPVLLLVVIVLLAVLLLAADRVFKAAKRIRRRREANRRLTAAEAQAIAKGERRQAAADASGALTSVMPTIHDLDPRHVE